MSDLQEKSAGKGLVREHHYSRPCYHTAQSNTKRTYIYVGLHMVSERASERASLFVCLFVYLFVTPCRHFTCSYSGREHPVLTLLLGLELTYP